MEKLIVTVAPTGSLPTKKITPYGWKGKILRIDLSKNAISFEDLDPKIAKAYICGRGLQSITSLS